MPNNPPRVCQCCSKTFYGINRQDELCFDCWKKEYEGDEMSKGPKRPGEDLMDQLSDVLGEEVTLYLQGQWIEFKIDRIEEGTGLLFGRKQPTGQQGCFRVSQITGYTEKD
jgi:hypothetical protein